LKSLNMTFYDYIDPQEQATINFTDEFAGSLLGLEARKATLRNVARGWNATYYSMGLWNGFQKPTIYVPNKPYSDAIFSPWVEYLQKKGVKIHTNNPIDDIEYNGTKVVSVTTASGIRVVADDFVLALDQMALPKIIKGPLACIPEISKACEIHKHGNNIWFGFMLYFSEEFSTDMFAATGWDQPWKPILQNYRNVWTSEAKQKCDSVELLQVSVMNFVQGHNGKILEECSVEEAVEETLLQLRQSHLMRDFRTVSGKSVWEAYDGYEVWPYWKTGSDGKMYNTLDEYKLSINQGVWERMPTTKTSVPNLFFGSVITQTDTPMVSMEIACTAGRNAAQAIATKYYMPSPTVYSHPTFLPVILAPLRALDTAIVQAPYLMLVVGFLLLILFVYKRTSF